MAVKRNLGVVYHGDKLMPWGKGCVSRGFVFLSGVEGRDPVTDEPREGIQAQTWLALDRIKQRLEEAGTNMDNIVKFVWYVSKREVKVDFLKSRDEWFMKNAPKVFKEKSFSGTLLVGVGLDLPDMLIEIDVVAAMPE